MTGKDPSVHTTTESHHSAALFLHPGFTFKGFDITGKTSFCETTISFHVVSYSDELVGVVHHCDEHVKQNHQRDDIVRAEHGRPDELRELVSCLDVGDVQVQQAENGPE